MNTELKTKWLEALRSGALKQGQSYLKYNEIDDHYCCLGVLCEISGMGRFTPIHDNYTQQYKTNNFQAFQFEHIEADGMRRWGNSEFLPEKMSDEIGLAIEVQTFLANANDEGFTFEAIADWIEAEL